MCIYIYIYIYMTNRQIYFLYTLLDFACSFLLYYSIRHFFPFIFSYLTSYELVLPNQYCRVFYIVFD